MPREKADVGFASTKKDEAQAALAMLALQGIKIHVEIRKGWTSYGHPPVTVALVVYGFEGEGPWELASQTFEIKGSPRHKDVNKKLLSYCRIIRLEAIKRIRKWDVRSSELRLRGLHEDLITAIPAAEIHDCRFEYLEGDG